mgnify:CR=1 FL=1
MDYMHYQRMPHIHGDLEPAFVVPPHTPCCPDEKEECVCVTSGDVEKWNETADMLSALSGITPEDLDNVASAVSALTSADYWNSTYNTVSTNSANWNSAYNAVTASADIWNSASDIPELTSAINDLSTQLSALDKAKASVFFTDSASIIGDGSSGSPYRVADWARISALNYNFNELERHLYPADSADGFTADMIITDGARAKFLALEPEHKKLIQFMEGIDTYISGLYDKVESANQLSYKAITEAKTYVGDGDTIMITPKYSDTEEGKLDDPKTREFVVSVVGLPTSAYSLMNEGRQALDYIHKNLSGRYFLSWSSVNYPTKDADVIGYNQVDTIYVAG